MDSPAFSHCARPCLANCGQVVLLRRTDNTVCLLVWMGGPSQRLFLTPAVHCHPHGWAHCTDTARRENQGSPPLTFHSSLNLKAQSLSIVIRLPMTALLERTEWHPQNKWSHRGRLGSNAGTSTLRKHGGFALGFYRHVSWHLTLKSSSERTASHADSARSR